jgi:hypothetical protein
MVIKILCGLFLTYCMNFSGYLLSNMTKLLAQSIPTVQALARFNQNNQHLGHSLQTQFSLVRAGYSFISDKHSGDNLRSSPLGIRKKPKLGALAVRPHAAE